MGPLSDPSVSVVFFNFFNFVPVVVVVVVDCSLGIGGTAIIIMTMKRLNC
jgi:hypothetical protein